MAGFSPGTESAMGSFAWLRRRARLAAGSTVATAASATRNMGKWQFHDVVLILRPRLPRFQRPSPRIHLPAVSGARKTWCHSDNGESVDIPTMFQMRDRAAGEQTRQVHISSPAASRDTGRWLGFPASEAGPGQTDQALAGTSPSQGLIVCPGAAEAQDGLALCSGQFRQRRCHCGITATDDVLIKQRRTHG